jgi:hypothetical protein
LLRFGLVVGLIGPDAFYGHKALDTECRATRLLSVPLSMDKAADNFLFTGRA